MKKERRQKAVPWVLLTAMIAAVLLSVNCGYSRIPYSDVIASLLNPGGPNASVILLQIRLPRIVLAVLCGIGLALSGCVLQAVTENPLADPGILGINAGAGFTVMLFLTLFPALHTSTMIYQPLFAMAGGLLAAVLLYVFSKRNGKVRPAYLLLGGIGLSAGFSSVMLIMAADMENSFWEKMSPLRWGFRWKGNEKSCWLWLWRWLPAVFPSAAVLALSDWSPHI